MNVRLGCISIVILMKAPFMQRIYGICVPTQFLNIYSMPDVIAIDNFTEVSSVTILMLKRHLALSAKTTKGVGDRAHTQLWPGPSVVLPRLTRSSTVSTDHLFSTFLPPSKQ